VRFKRPSKGFEAITGNHLAVITVGDITGLPVMLDGNAVGAIGVSGGDPEQDEQCADAGLAAHH
jgi:uncharacterized protein GlcG (DUF336 family)